MALHEMAIRPSPGAVLPTNLLRLCPQCTSPLSLWQNYQKKLTTALTTLDTIMLDCQCSHNQTDLIAAGQRWRRRLGSWGASRARAAPGAVGLQTGDRR